MERHDCRVLKFCVRKQKLHTALEFFSTLSVALLPAYMSTDPMPSSSAVHTTDCILHPAARIDFEQHVRLLWEAGRKDEAETLWNSVVEVQHQPAPRAPILHGTDLPAMAAVPCTEPECERCTNRRGYFASLGLESGAKTGCSSDMVCRHKRLGRIGRSRPVTWTCCSFRCMEVAFLVRTLFRRHGSKLLPGRR